MTRKPTRRTEADRLALLEDAVDRLRETAESGTVVVEGARDRAALDWLGIGGTHVVVHQGDGLALLMEDLVAAPPPVVLLVDWDRTGGRLLARLETNLRARVQVDVLCRRRFASCCHSRTLEEVPSELEALRRSVGTRR
jgi:5S rRNA maturation endonuclease (ribonuclease M5)